MTFGAKLKLVCDHRGLSQADLRRGLGNSVAVSTVSNWFTERFKPDVDVAFRIAKVIGMPIELLADDEVGEDQILRHLRGEDDMDPAQRAMYQLAGIFGWRALVERLTNITSVRLGDEVGVRVVEVSRPARAEADPLVSGGPTEMHGQGTPAHKSRRSKTG